MAKIEAEDITTLTIGDNLDSEKQEYLSAKQSLNRMSSRLRKVCKRLTPTTEIVLEMQKIADEIREYAKKATSEQK